MALTHLDIRLEFIANHGAFVRLDAKEIASSIEYFRMRLFPRQIRGDEHAVEMAADMQLVDLLALRIRRAIGDERQEVAGATHALQQLHIVGRYGQVTVA